MNKRLFWILFTVIFALATFLRLYKLTQLPPSLYWEEAALGYDAYSIAETGKDHHGHPFPIVAFESFGDWKPSLYFYAVVPFVKILGLNAWAVRLPSVLSGISIVIGVGLLARVFAKKTQRDFLQLIAMGITAIFPWMIQFSRAGWEVNLATALMVWGVVCFWRGLENSKQHSKWLVGAAALLVLSMYTYHAARMIAPLLGLALVAFSIKERKLQNWKSLSIAGAVAVVLLVPLITTLGSKTTNQRFAETSIFSDLTVIERSNTLKERANNSLPARFFYHRYLLFGREMLINALSHFHPNFLFVSGDSNLRHSVQYVGQLYHIEAVFLLLGLVYIIFNWQSSFLLLFTWAFIGLLPASMTKATPHALRILPMVPVFLIMISLGIKQALELAPKKIGMVLIVGLYLAELTLFWRFYTTVYPKMYAQAWQYGYEQMIKNVQEVKATNTTTPIYITREQGRPAMFYWFFAKTNPRSLQAANATAKKDQGEFLEFENIKFVNSVFEVVEAESFVVSSVEEKDKLPANKEVISEVSDPRGTVIWVLYKVHAL